MRSKYLLLPLAALYLGACGDDGDDHGDDDHDHDAAAPIDSDPGAPDADPTAPDAAPAPDAEPSSVVEVTCASVTPDAEVTATAGTFNPVNTTISVDEIVEFTMPASHSVVSGTPGNTNDDFAVSFSQTKCYRFTEAGTYPFFCNPHQFTGSIVVE